MTDGPFMETKEQLGGFYLISAADLDEALELAGRVPMPIGVHRGPTGQVPPRRVIDVGVEAALTRLAREESGPVVALLARQFRDLDLADDAVQDALLEATAEVAGAGVPDNPAGWLRTVARTRAIDRLRRAESAHRRTMAAAPTSSAESAAGTSARRHRG